MENENRRKGILKREFRLFFLTDYEAEEEYLAQRHKEGYAFVKVTVPGIYTFVKCEPKDVTYRLDFHPLNESEKESYLQLYRDYGWEYLDELNDYSYFRKTAANVSNDDELEIFSDSESKMAMLKSIFIKRMLLVLAIVLLIGVPLWYQTITDAIQGALHNRFLQIT